MRLLADDFFTEAFYPSCQPRIIGFIHAAWMDPGLPHQRKAAFEAIHARHQVRCGEIPVRFDRNDVDVGRVAQRLFIRKGRRDRIQ